MGEELNTTLMGLASEGQIGTLMMPVKHENGSIQTLTRALYREPTSIEFSTLRTDEDCNRGKVDFGTCDQLVHVGRQEGLKSEMGALRVGLDYIANDANRGTVEELKRWTTMTENATRTLLDDMRYDKEELRETLNNLTITKRKEVDELKRKVAGLEFAAGLREEKGLERTMPIKRFPGGELTYSAYLEFAKRSEPFVVSWGKVEEREGGGAPGVPGWTLESIKQKCSGKHFLLKTEDDDPIAHSWARLKRVGRAKIEDYIDGLTGAGDMDDTTRNFFRRSYLHDASLQQLCPELLEEVIIPKFFSLDLTQHLPEGFNHNYPSNYWPSLFIGPGGSTNSALHADILDTAAWMGVVKGRKHWRIVPPQDRFLLHERPEKRNVFEADLFEPKEAYKSVRYATVYDTVLEEGDVLFIPAASAHQVKNLYGDITIAIAMNYVDEGNVKRFLNICKEVRIDNGDTFGRYVDEVRTEITRLREEMGGGRDKGGDKESTRDVRFRELKIKWD